MRTLAIVVAVLVSGGGVETLERDKARTFLEAVDAYVHLHQEIEATLSPIGMTRDPWLLFDRKRQLGDAIRAARPAAFEGEIFGNEVAAELRASVGDLLSPADIEALRLEAQCEVNVVVNGTLPAGLSHGMPPRLLARFPELPGELEYRIVNADLVLWDVDADVIVDVLRDLFVVPSYAWRGGFSSGRAA